MAAEKADRPISLVAKDIPVNHKIFQGGYEGKPLYVIDDYPSHLDERPKTDKESPVNFRDDFAEEIFRDQVEGPLSFSNAYPTLKKKSA